MSKVYMCDGCHEIIGIAPVEKRTYVTLRFTSVQIASVILNDDDDDAGPKHLCYKCLANALQVLLSTVNEQLVKEQKQC